MKQSSIIRRLFSPVDLTKGKPIKSLLVFMLPILLSLVFQQIYTISDAAIVGQTLSKVEVAGVNDVYGLFYIVIQFSFGCAAGFSVISSEKAGENDEEGIRKSFAAQILLSTILSLLLTAIFVPLVPSLLKVIGLEENNPVFPYAKKYLAIIYLGLFTQVFYNLVVSVLRSIGDSFAPLMFLIGSTILNIGLDFLFIMSFKWGVGGAAIATIIAQFLAAVVSFIYCMKKYSYLRVRLNDFKVGWKSIYNHLKLGLPLALQYSIIAIGLIILEKAVIRFDIAAGVEDAQVGYGAGVKFNDFMMTPFIALGTAVLSYHGQNLGARDAERIKSGFKDSMLLVLIMYIVFGGISALCSINGAFVSIFLSPSSINDRVRFYAKAYMLADASCYIFLGSLIVFRNTLQGLEKPIYPFLSGIAELIGRSFISELMPKWIDSSNPISDKAFIGVAFSDSMAWLLSILVMGYGIYKYILRDQITRQIALKA